MSKINIGIIGTGSIVDTYAKCIDELQGTELVALFTKSSHRIKEVEKKFGVQAFSDMDKFLDQNEIDMVCVCNESGRHGEVIKASAKAGKHILSEKPLEVTTEKIDEVIDACREHKVKLGCVLQNRCSADYRLAEEAIKSDKLGKLLMGNAHINWYRSEEYYAKSDWRGTMQFDGGAAFMNQGIHTIDLLINIMGVVNSVFGNIKTAVHQIEGEDVGTAILNFSNGSLGNITAGTALYPGYPERLEFYGEKGSILMEGGKIVQWNVQNMSSPELASNSNGGSGAADPTAIGHQNHKTVVRDMVEAIQKNRPPMVEAHEARKAVAVINAIYESSKREKLVYL